MKVLYTVAVELNPEATHASVPDIGQRIAATVEEALQGRADVLAVEAVDASYTVARRRVRHG